MINLRYFVMFFLSSFIVSNEFYFSFSFSLFLTILIRIINESNNSLVFREFTLLLYCLNYLLSPSISFLLGHKIVSYGLKLTASSYFNLAIPGFVCFYVGISCVKTNLFSPKFINLKITTLLNEKLLKQTVVLAILVSLIKSFLPSELAFICYLFSLLQYVAALSLFALNPKHNIIWPAATIIIILYKSILDAMYHDAIIWIIFFSIFYLYIIKPTLKFKILGILVISIFIFFLQSFKAEYRSQVWSGDKLGNLATVGDVVNATASSETIFGEQNLLVSLTRLNQAWIFASTVDNMDRYKNFQGLNNVYKYLEASLLPRFLSPDKIKSGDQEIFNVFSGHSIDRGTSMGLGIFADGYIAYGTVGVYIFGFALGLIFALTFKLVESWTKISPFYALLIFPLLSYAIRPDCELQTTINHLSKGILFYGIIVWYTKRKLSFVIESKAK